MEYIKTISGDTWDTVAKRVYGDERYAQELMEERRNIALLDYQIFPGGIVIATPEIREEIVTSDLPAWRK